MRQTGLVWNLRHATTDAAFEIDPIFLSTFRVMVHRAQHLTELVDHLQTIRPMTKLSLKVAFSNEVDYLVRCKGDNAWTRAFKDFLRY